MKYCSKGTPLEVPPGLLDLEEAAKLFDISVDALSSASLRGALPSSKIGRKIYFRRSAIEHYAANRRMSGPRNKTPKP